MAARWDEVSTSPEYQALPEDEKGRVKERYWTNVVAASQDYNSLDAKSKGDVRNRFFGPTVAPVKTPAVSVAPSARPPAATSSTTFPGRAAFYEAAKAGTVKPGSTVKVGGRVFKVTRRKARSAAELTGYTPEEQRRILASIPAVGLEATSDVIGSDVPPLIEKTTAMDLLLGTADATIQTIARAAKSSPVPTPLGTIPSAAQLEDRAARGEGVNYGGAAARAVADTGLDVLLPKTTGEAALLAAGIPVARGVSALNLAGRGFKALGEAAYLDEPIARAAAVLRNRMPTFFAAGPAPKPDDEVMSRILGVAPEPAAARSVSAVPPPRPPTVGPVGSKPGPGPTAKPRKFLETVSEAPNTSPELKAAIGELDGTYEPITNKATLDKARALVKESPDRALSFVHEEGAPTADHTATASELIKRFQGESRFKEAADVADAIAAKLTQSGQTIQAAKLYANLEPQSVLVRAQKLVREANRDKGLFGRFLSDVKLDETTVKKLTDLAGKMKGTTGDLKLELADQIQGILQSIPRVSLGRRISSAQTAAQLLNPKTVIRNVVGNELFYRIEQINKLVATPIDLVRSKLPLVGGPRVVTFRGDNQGSFWKDLMRGTRAGWRGTAPEGLATQFDLTAPAFKSKWNPLRYLERATGASLKGFDYAAYQRAKNQTLGELGYLKAWNSGLRGQELRSAAKEYAIQADDNLLKIAQDYGKYVTFQDENVVSGAFSKLKRVLNLGQDFGLGDLVLKYPRTPGALLMRAMEYSPAGFLRSAYIAGAPWLKGGAVPVREAELALSRAITGSVGLTGLGYYLADVGILTGEPPSNRNIAALQRSEGAGAYRINLDALGRWVRSGFNRKAAGLRPGDRMYSYDWAQPVAVAMSLGANMNRQVKASAGLSSKRGAFAGVPGIAASSVEGGVNTLAEQPLVSGVKRFASGSSAWDSVARTVEQLPASMTPTVLNQFRNLADPVSRETYSPNVLKRALNRAAARVPGLAQKLPVRYDTLGRPSVFPQKPTAGQIFLNPGFLTKYEPTPAAQLVLDVYNATGETRHVPKVAPRKLSFYEKQFQLDGARLADFQRRLGTATDQVFSALAGTPAFRSMPAQKQADMLNYALGKIYAREKLKTLTTEEKQSLVRSLTPDQRKRLAGDIRAAFSR